MHAGAPYTTPFLRSSMQHTPMGDIRCLTTCKIIIFWDTKLSPNEFVNFDLSPFVPGYYFLGVEGGVGVKIWLAYSCHCALIRTRSLSTFFFYMDPLTNEGGPGCYLHLCKICPPMRTHRWALRRFWAGMGYLKHRISG